MTEELPTMQSLIDKISCLHSIIENLQNELSEEDVLRNRLSQLLADTATALHGGSKENGSWSWHDLPELAESKMNRITELERQCEPIN